MHWTRQAQTNQKDMQGRSAAPLKIAGCYTVLVSTLGKTLRQSFVKSPRLLLRCNGLVFYSICVFFCLLGRMFMSSSCKAILLSCIIEYKSVKRACGLFLQSKTWFYFCTSSFYIQLLLAAW